MLTRMYVPSWRMYSSTESYCEQLPHIHTHTKTYVLKLYQMWNVRLLKKAPSSSSLLYLAVMQMDDDLPVHLNVYIMETCEKVQNILLVSSLDVMVVHKVSY